MTESDPTYSFKASLMGAPTNFALRQEGLQWERGPYSGFVRYDQIRSIRLSFRPSTMQMQRYIAEIWSSNAPKLDRKSTRLNSSH